MPASALQHCIPGYQQWGLSVYITSWLLHRGTQCNLCIYSGYYIARTVYSGHPSGPNQLAATQRWHSPTVEPVYSGQPSGPKSWLLYIQRWPAHTVEPVYSDHPSGPNNWLLYRGGLFMPWNHGSNTIHATPLTLVLIGELSVSRVQ